MNAKADNSPTVKYQYLPQDLPDKLRRLCHVPDALGKPRTPRQFGWLPS